jgi:hypothetical protein
VDSFQGSECDCVILSFVRANEQKTQGFIKEYQRLNVALTRGKHILFCVGNERTLTGVRRSNMQCNHDYRASNDIEQQDSKRMRGVDGVAVSRLFSTLTASSSFSAVPAADNDENAVLSVDSLGDMIRDAKSRGRYFEEKEIVTSMEGMCNKKRG